MSARFFHLSETSAGVQFGDRIDPGLHHQVIRAYRYFRANPFPGFREAVPAYASLSIYYDPMRMPAYMRKDASLILELLNDLLVKAMAQHDPDDAVVPPVVRIPVCYHPLVADDLEWTAFQTGLSPERIVDLHTGIDYTVYMLGFVPGFPYLGVLPEALEVPRKLSPSEAVPPGSVAIAGRQTGIYPFTTPGGWQVIGRTPVKLFDTGRDPVCLLKPGDHVRFEPITLHEYLNAPRT